MSNKITYFAFSLLMLFSVGTAFGQDDWELKSDKDGVKVYYKKTATVHEVKLVTSIQSSLSGIIQLFNEVDNYPRWGYKVTSSKLVKKVSDQEMYYHSKFDFPWPMDDRDVVMHTKLFQDSKTKAIYSTSVASPKTVGEEKGFVRITNSTTKWTLIPGTNGWVYVEYYVSSSPGGNIPDWLVNMAIDVGPRETIKNMKTILKQPTYKNAKLAYIKE
jgi:hypothetical protein